MNVYLFSLFIGCSSCQPKPPPPPPIIEEPQKEVPVEQTKAQIATAAIEQMKANFKRVYFDLNSADLNDDSRAALDENLSIMQKVTELSIEIQGHADERGTTEYNVSLGQKRAEKISQHFTLQGIAPSRIKIISYGEERPAVEGSSEAIWSKNRRCEFVILRSDNPGIKGTVE